MRKELDDKIESGRITSGPYGSHKSAAMGVVGAFKVFGPCGTTLSIMASDGVGDPVCEGWEHVSVAATHRPPNWQEMCWAKAHFWLPDEWVVQYHPAERDLINHHPHCLHLWRHAVLPFPRPPVVLV